MELKDVEMKVEDPNQEYWIGLSTYSSGFGWENFYTDGSVRILADEGVYSGQSNLVKVEDATYVAFESFFDLNETDRSKMKEHGYTLIGNDPAETVKQIGLDKIFCPEGAEESLTTSCIYAKKGIPHVADPGMLPRRWK